MTVLCINISLGLISRDSCTKKFRQGRISNWRRWMSQCQSIYLYTSTALRASCLAVEAGFYSDVVECLSVNPASWVWFPTGQVGRFLLYDITWIKRYWNSLLLYETHEHFNWRKNNHFIHIWISNCHTKIQVLLHWFWYSIILDMCTS